MSAFGNERLLAFIKGWKSSNIWEQPEQIKILFRKLRACYHSMQNLLSSSLLSKNIKIIMYRTTTLSVILYGYETWSLILREERRLRVFENRVLRNKFGPKRDKVTGEWEKLHSEGLIRLIKSKRMRWAWHIARMGKKKGAYRVLVGKPKRKTQPEMGG